MATKPVDAISSFQHVVDNAPAWHQQISSLIQHTTKRHEEFVEEYARLLHQARPKRQKSASITSLRSSEEQSPEQPLKSPQLSQLIDINPLEAGNRFIYAQAHRKRRPGTSLRSNNSGPRQQRTKQMVVIYYDSHIQTELDQLVRALGAARNNLRKGKIAYNAAKGFTLPTLGRRYEGIDNLVPNLMSRGNNRSPKLANATAPIATTGNSDSPEAIFTQIDKEVEQVQSLCETAAHSAIREGTCKVELSEALVKLDVMGAMAKSALESLRDAEEEETQKLENASMSDKTSTQSTLYEKSSLEVLGTVHKTPPPLKEVVEITSRDRSPLRNPLSVPSVPPISDAIEVDDDDDDDASSIEIDLNMGRFRTASRRVAI